MRRSPSCRRLDRLPRFRVSGSAHLYGNGHAGAAPRRADHASRSTVIRFKKESFDASWLRIETTPSEPCGPLGVVLLSHTRIPRRFPGSARAVRRPEGRLVSAVHSASVLLLRLRVRRTPSGLPRPAFVHTNRAYRRSVPTDALPRRKRRIRRTRACLTGIHRRGRYVTSRQHTVLARTSPCYTRRQWSRSRSNYRQRDLGLQYVVAVTECSTKELGHR